MKRFAHHMRKKLATLGHPGSVAEWQSYVSVLTGTALWEQALAMNSMEFVGRLREEGLSCDNIADVMRELAKQFVRVGMKIPEEGVFDLVRIADAERESVTPLTDEQVAGLQAHSSVAGDELDLMFAELGR